MTTFEKFKELANYISDSLNASALREATNLDYSKKDDYLIDVSYIGGMSGGSCWNDGSETFHYELSDELPEFKGLDTLLTSLTPSIPYLEYKKILKLIKEGYFTESEYYGNTSDYKVSYLDLQELYSILTNWFCND